mmetsp:Transcript_3688/g.4091  ORF Transcript_3688/g.4091 Transcript_3688/m.4091 type:complete len:335 (-) Transcript_3688:20-1024(-)
MPVTKQSVVIALTLLALVVCYPTVPLHNGATPGMRMPVVGLGTGPYGTGEHWDNTVSEKATAEWLELGGRRIDTSTSYGTQIGIGNAIAASKIPRSEIFVTSKIAQPYPLDYNSSFTQFKQIQEQLQTDYVDLLLIHWPGWVKGTTPRDGFPPCYENDTWKKCRVEAWKALQDIFHKGGAKAIGVSNFEINHLSDIMEIPGNIIPAVNQVECHPYWHEPELIAFCKSHKIQFNTYSPFAAPDHMKFNPAVMPVLLPNNTVVKSIASSHKKSPAQVCFRWAVQQNLVINPRTLSGDHMKENMDIFDFKLTDEEMKSLSALNHPMRKVCPDPHKIE